MLTRLIGTHDAWRSFIAAIVALALVMVLGAASASAASPAACRVQNTDTGKAYKTLQAAVDAARKDDRLTVRGTCHGTVVIDKSILIEGIRAASRPLLAGDREGVVVTVRKGVTATVKDLAIEGGRGRFRRGGPEKPYNWPAGVLNRGNLTLHSVAVKKNQGGIGIENAGTLRMKGDSIVRDNGFDWHNVHEGIHNTGTLRMNGTASVRRPDSVKNEGSLVMNGASHIRYLTNRGTATLKDTSWTTKVVNRGTLTLGDESRIVGLSPYSFLVGVDNFGTLILNDASGIVHGYVGVWNWPGSKAVLNGTSVISGHQGGAVRNSGTLVLNGSSSIRENRYLLPPCGSHCSHDPLRGAGVFNTGALVLNDSSSITGNSVQDSHDGSLGGGVHMMRDPSRPEPPSLTMTGSSSISGNRAGDSGGGLFAGVGSVLTGVSCGPQTLANVYGNTPDDCHIE